MGPASIKRKTVPESQRAALQQDDPDTPDNAGFRQSTLQHAIQQNLLNDDRLVAGFVDVDGVRNTIRRLQSAFPPHFRHTFAAKANAMTEALRLVRDAGIGCEVASPAELQLALSAGFEPGMIVHDEPAKTLSLLRLLLGRSIAFNIDNFQELARVVELQKQLPSSAPIGFRINPQVGSGKIGAMSTATRDVEIRRRAAGSGQS